MTPEERFAELYEEHAPYLRRRLRSMRIPPSLHEDVAQEVWLTVHRRIGDLRTDSDPRPWISQILRNHLLHQARSFARKTRRERAFVSLVDQHHEPHRQIEALSTVQYVLATLHADQREALVDSDVLGMTAPEIAATRGLSVNTVYSRIRLARARVRDLAVALALLVLIGVDDLRRRVEGALSGGGLDRVRGTPVSSPGRLLATSTPVATTVQGAALGLAVGVLSASVDTPSSSLSEYAAARELGGRSVDVSAPLRLLRTDAVARQSGGRARGDIDVNSAVISAVISADPRRAEAKPRRRSRRGRPTAGRRSSPDTGPRLLRRGLAELRAGDPKRALGIAEEHLRRFPKSALAITRTGLMIDALCELGRPTQAKRLYDRELATHRSAALHRAMRREECW